MTCANCRFYEYLVAYFAEHHNAALISAAPELYEACKWAEAALAPFSKDPAEKSGISMLRTALAKARGPA